jgi:type II secretory pathway pseudopilin PulG
MRTRYSTQLGGYFPARNQAGMTLVEVIVSLVITVLVVAGIVNGYIYCTTAAVKAELAEAANAKMLQCLEEARSATWNTSSLLAEDQLVTTNFATKVVTLDMPDTNTVGTSATITTTIAPIAFASPMRTIHVDCVWQFRGAEWITNSIETIRAADQ